MRKTNSVLVMDKKILALIIIMFLCNLVLLFFGYRLLSNHITSGTEIFADQQKMAKDLVEYNRRLAKTLGVDTRAQVHEALSRFNYEIELATNAEELNKVILNYASRTQEKVLEEYEAKQRETVLMLINQDPNLKDLAGKQRLTVRLGREEGVRVEPDGLVTEDTITAIADTIALGNLVQDLVVEIEVENGRGQLLVPVSLADQIRSLNKEIDALRVTVHDLRTQAGFAEMTGPGIYVRIYDAKNGYTNDAIIHETDVRDVVNELFAAGARGVDVGGQRLTATSAIRCVGPSILVNDERIAVNPVVIRAIGDPEVLASGLDIIRITLEISRRLTVEIEPAENLTLPAYIPRR
ncbi:MAG TPA: DUF881 domain-containing protein [Firmicutes bacterium]|nr:DUF881 domain-containing protein [Bacillota bacterium]